MSVDITYLKECFDYDPETGDLIWRRRPVEHFNSLRGFSVFNSQHPGTQAGATDGCGHIQVIVKKKLHHAHRLIWAMTYGFWPTNEIDHIDGNPSNNRISNLREATHSQNGKNQKMPRNNTSGFKGVHWHKRIGKFEGSIRSDGKHYHLGYFDDPKDAHAAYCAAADRLHKEFANHGH